VGGGFIALKTAKVEDMHPDQVAFFAEATLNEVKLLHYLAANANVIDTYGHMTTNLGPSFAVEFSSQGSLTTFVRYALNNRGLTASKQTSLALGIAHSLASIHKKWAFFT